MASGVVDVPVPTAAAGAAGCARLATSLPASLEGPDGPLARRPVSGDATRTAAWGSPAVTLECGVAPGDLTREVLSLGPADGATLTFESDDVGSATAFTTGELEVDVRITVPDPYDATLLVDLVPLLRAALATPSPSARP